MAVDLATLNIQFAADVAELEAALSSAQSSMEEFKASTADLANISFTGDSAPLIGATDEAKSSLTSFKEEAAGLGTVQFSGDAAPLLGAIDEGKSQLTSFKEEAAGLGAVELRGDAAPLTAAIGEAKGELNSYKASAEEGAAVQFRGDAAPLVAAADEAKSAVESVKEVGDGAGSVTFRGDATPLVVSSDEAKTSLLAVQDAAQQTGSATEDAGSKASQMGSSMEESAGLSGILSDKLEGLGSTVEFLAGAAGFIALFDAITTTGEAIAKANEQFDVSSTMLTQVMGSADAAREHLEQIERLGTEYGFSLPGLEQADQRLIEVGVSADRIPTIFHEVMDAATAMGDGQEGVDKVTNALKRMDTTGQASSRTMMAFAQEGIPIYQGLAQVLGTDVAGAMEAVKKNSVDSQEVFDALDIATQKYTGDAELHATTFQGAMQRIEDAVEMLSTAGLRPLFEGLTLVGNGFADYLTGIATAETETQAFNAAFGPLGPVLQAVYDQVLDLGGKFSEWASKVSTEAGPALKSLGDTISNDLFPALKDLFSAVTGDDVTDMSDFGDVIESQVVPAVKDLTNLTDGVKDLVDQFKQANTDLQPVADVLNGVNDVAGNLGGLLHDAAAGATDAGDSAEGSSGKFNDLDTAFSGANVRAGSFADFMLNKVPEAFSSANSSMDNFGGDMDSKLGSAWESAKSTVSSALSGIGSTISSWASSAGSFLSGLGSSLVSAAGTAFSALGSAIGAALSSITDSRFHPWVALVVSIFTDLANLLPQILSAAWTSISTTASSALSSIETIISSAWDSVSSNTSSVYDSIASYLGGWWTTLESTFNTALTAVENVLSTAWNWVSSTTTSIYDSIASYLGGWWSTLESTFNSALSTVETVVSTAWNWVSSETTSVYDSIASFLTGWWDTLTAGFNTAVDTIESLLASAWDTIASTAATGWGIIKDNIVTPVIEAYDKVVDVMNGIIEAVAGVLSKIAPNTAAALQGFELSKISFGTGGTTEGSSAGDGSGATQSFATGGVTSQTPGYTEERLVEWGEQLQPGQREYFLTEHPDYKERNFALWQDYGSRQGFVPREIVNQDAPATSVPWAQAQQSGSSSRGPGGAPAMSFATGGMVWQDILTGNPATDMHNVARGAGASPNLSFSSPGSTNNASGAASDFSQTNNTTNIFNSVMINGQQVSGGSGAGGGGSSLGGSAGGGSSAGGSSAGTASGLLNIAMPAAMWAAMQQDAQSQNAAALGQDFDPSQVQMVGSGAPASGAASGGSPSAASGSSSLGSASPTLSATAPAGGASTSQNVTATATAGGVQAQSFAPLIQQAAAASSGSFASAQPTATPAPASQPTTAAPTGSASDTAAPSTSGADTSGAAPDSSGVPAAVSDMQSRGEQAIGSGYNYGSIGIYAGPDGYSCSGLWDWIVYGETGDLSSGGTYDWDAGMPGWSTGPGNVEVGVTLGGGGGPFGDDTHMGGDIYGTVYESDAYDGVTHGAFMGGAQNFPDVWHMDGYARGGIRTLSFQDGGYDTGYGYSDGGSAGIPPEIQDMIARAQEAIGNPYIYGSIGIYAGPGGYSCSGLWDWIVYGETGDLSSGGTYDWDAGMPGWAPGPGNIEVGIDVSGDVPGDGTHMSGDIYGTPYEADLVDGVSYGAYMGGAQNFPDVWHLEGYAQGGIAQGGYASLADKYRNPGLLGGSSQIQSYVQQRFNQQLSANLGGSSAGSSLGVGSAGTSAGGGGAAAASPSSATGSGAAAAPSGASPGASNSMVSLSVPQSMWSAMVSDDQSGNFSQLLSDFDPSQFQQVGGSSPGSPGGTAPGATTPSAAGSAPGGSASLGGVTGSLGGSASNVVSSVYNQSYNQLYKNPTGPIVQMARGGMRMMSFDSGGYYDENGDWVAPGGYDDPEVAAIDQGFADYSDENYGSADSPAGLYDYATSWLAGDGADTAAPVIDQVGGWAGKPSWIVGGLESGLDYGASLLGFARGGMRGGGNLTFTSPNLTNNAPSADFSGSGSNMNNTFQSVMMNGQQMYYSKSSTPASGSASGDSSSNVSSTVSGGSNSTVQAGGSNSNVQSTVSNSNGGGSPADQTIAPGMTSTGLVSPSSAGDGFYSNVVSSDYSNSYDTVYIDPTQPIVQMARGGSFAGVPRFSFADGGSLTGAQIQAGLDAGNAAVGDFYQPGGVGPPGDGYDCSGLWNWIESGIAYGSPVAERRWGTYDMPAPGWNSGTGQVTVGVGLSGWGGPDGCLSGDTLVYGPEGAKRMDALKAGDRVYSYAGGEIEARAVSAAWFSKRQMTYALRVVGREVIASANHPFLREGGEWARLDALKPGERIAVLYGAPEAFGFEAIEAIEAHEAIDTFDIEVAGSHNFIANGVVVHNSHMAGNVTGTGFEADEANNVSNGGISGADPFAFDNQYFLGDTSYVGTSTSGSGAIHALAKAAMDGVIGTVIDPLLGGTWPGGVVGQGMQEFAKSVPTKVEDWVLSQLPGGGGGTSGSGSASSGADLPSDAMGWITQGLADTGEPASWAPDIEWIMNHESGGQNIDNLEGSGASGPMQTMPDTFAAYQVVGHPDPSNPQDEVDAAINYIAEVYGSPDSIPGVGQADWPGYASGGIITKPQLAWLGEGGSPEAVVPLDDPSKIANFVNTFAPPSSAGLSNSYAPPVGGAGSGGSSAGGVDPATLARAVEDGLRNHTDAVTGAIKDNTNMDISNVDDLAKAMIVGAHSYSTSDLGKKTMDNNLAQGLNQFVQYLPASQ